MAIKFKPLFCCDGCGSELEDPDQVRIFEGVVKNGEGNKIFIPDNKMYCLNCLQFALDYENTVPETVQIIDLKDENFLEAKESKLSLTDIKTQVESIKQECKIIGKYLKNHVDQFNRVDKRLNALETISLKPLVKLNTLESLPEDEPQIPNEEFKKEFETKSIINQEEFLEEGGTEKFDLSTSQEPDITTENIESDTEEGADESLIGDNDGKYLILFLISNEIDERKFGQKQGYKDAKDLRQACGLKSLIGLYYSTNRYSDSTDIGKHKKIISKVINRIFFGVPNIVEREIYSYDTGIALIEKDKFEDKIEAVKYEVPEEDTSNIGFPEGAEIIKSDEELKPSVNKLLKGFVSDVVRDSEIKPKKRFSGRDIRDEYV